MTTNFTSECLTSGNWSITGNDTMCYGLLTIYNHYLVLRDIITHMNILYYASATIDKVIFKYLRIFSYLLGAELAQLVRWMTLNLEVPSWNLAKAI